MMRELMLGLLLAGAAGAARAQDPTGDWIGKVTLAPGAEINITAHIEKDAAGGLKGVGGSPDQTPQPLPLTDVKVAGDTLSFSVPAAQASYTGKWDAAAGGWVGVLAQNGADLPLTFVHGTAPARPVIAGLDGEWTGILEAPQADLHIVIRIKTDEKGTLALLSSPDQSPAQAVAKLTREGDKVGVAVPALGRFDGVLSADGKTLDGSWKQGGGSLPLVMKRGG
jgi:hypothetical protein